MEILLQFGINNLLLSLLLALLAIAAMKWAKNPSVSHVLWILVILKLSIPPLMNLPVFIYPIEENRLGEIASLTQTSELGSTSNLQFGRESHSFGYYIMCFWIVGSLIALFISLRRITLFNRVLSKSERPFDSEKLSNFEEISILFGIQKTPLLKVVSANISPLVWWVGGKRMVVLPESIVKKLTHKELSFVIAHELAHIKRKDYFVRWLELIVCIIFWWNPLIWWAQRQLRNCEEICCDQLAIERIQGKPKSYANALLKAIEFLVHPGLRQPVAASGMNSGGLLERRLKMIINKDKKGYCSSWCRIVLIAGSLAILPLGLVVAQEFGAVEKRLAEAVSNGEISLKQAAIMMEALHESSDKYSDGKKQKDLELAERKEKYVQAEKKLKDMVIAGDLSKRDAFTRLAALKKKLFGKEFEVAGQNLKDSEKKNSQKNKHDGALKKRYSAYKERLESQVKSGKLSEDDAKVKLDHLRAQLGEQAQKQKMEMRERRFNAYKKELSEALKAGKLTREEAAEKMEMMEKKLSR